MNGELIGVWIAAGLTLLIFSFIYKDNPAFKFAEALYLGVALGYTAVNTYWTSIVPTILDPWLAGGTAMWLMFIPLILGIFIILRVVPRLAWLSRYSFAIYIAAYAGLAVPNEIAGKLLPQVASTMNPITMDFAGLSQLIVLVGVFCTMMYFFFSLEHKGVVGKISRIGVLFVMISFGASFGYTVMARVSLLIGRVQFLFFDWLKLQG